MKNLLDLRFVIGVFFLTVGLLLVIYHLAGSAGSKNGSLVNLETGLIFMVFGAAMTILSFVKKLPEES